MDLLNLTDVPRLTRAEDCKLWRTTIDTLLPSNDQGARVTPGPYNDQRSRAILDYLFQLSTSSEMLSAPQAVYHAASLRFSTVEQPRTLLEAVNPTEHSTLDAFVWAYISQSNKVSSKVTKKEAMIILLEKFEDTEMSDWGSPPDNNLSEMHVGRIRKG